HGLHSRAQQVLQLLLKEDLIQASDLRPVAASMEAKSAAAGTETSADAAATVVVSQERLRARAAAVARVSVARLLDHLRLGKGEEFWVALLAETNARLRSFEVVAAATAAGPSPAAGVAARSLARMLLLVSEAVGYFRGSRVESYKPLMELLGRLMQPVVWLPSTLAADAAGNGNSSGGSGGSGSSSGNSSPNVSPIASPRLVPVAALPVPNSDDDGDGDDDLYDVSLSYAVLELVRCVVYGNLRAVGASEGPEALVGCAASWSPCFSRPPAAEALLFVKSLMVRPADAEITRLFAAQIMGCLGRFIMQEQPSQQQMVAKQQQQQQQEQQTDVAGSALLLLRDLCDLLQPPQHQNADAVVRPAVGLPLLLTAQPHGVRLAAHVRALATDWRPETDTDPRVSAKVWAAVSLLPHACESEFQAVAICEQVLEAASAALRNRPSEPRQTNRPKQVSGASTGDAKCAAVDRTAAALDAEGGLLLIRATATELLAGLLQRQQKSGLSLSLVKVAEASVQWMMDRLDERPSRDSGLGADYASLRAAGSLLSAVRTSITHAATMGSGAIIEMASGLLSESRLKQMVGRLAPLLAHESQPLRAAVLRVLCCFDQPALEALGPDAKDPTAAIKKQQKQQHGLRSAATISTGPRCDLLEALYGINSQPFTIESGRKWAVAISRLKTYLEYNRIPEFLVPAFAYGMVGVLYIRFSPLWQPASEALAACIQFQSQASWPVVFSFLQTCQAELLSGDFPAAAASSGQDGSGGGRRTRGRHRSAAAISAAITAAPVVRELASSQDASLLENLTDRYETVVRSGTPQAGGGMTDPQNRLSHVLRAMAMAPYSTIEGYSKDWMPLFLDYTAARGGQLNDGERDVEAAAARPRKKARTRDGAVAAKTHGSIDQDDGDNDEPAMKERRESHGLAGCSSDKAAVAAAATAPGGKRKLPKNRTAAAAGAAELPTANAVSVLSRIGGKTWRAGLLDWLKLLAGLRGVRGLHRWEELQKAVSSHLLEADSNIQVAVLRCLKTYRFRWLPAEMSDRLGRLADDATLREELVVFPLVPGADGGIGEESRPGLIPLLVRVLFPKMRKRSGRLGGRGAPGSARAAILNFLAGLRPEELRPLLELLLEPMQAAFTPPPLEAAAAVPPRAGTGAATTAAVEELDRYRLLPPPWWSAPMLTCGVGWWLKAVDSAALDVLPARRKVGFLNAFEDLLSHLGHGLEPFLPTMLAITLRLLTTATAAITATGGGGGGKDEVPPASEPEMDEQLDEQDRDAAEASSSDATDDDNEDDDVNVNDDVNDVIDVDTTRMGKKNKNALQRSRGSGKDAVASSKDAGQKAAEVEVEGQGAGDIDVRSDGDDDGGDDAAAAVAEPSDPGPIERHREVRSTALRLLAQVWLRFPASTSTDYNELWGVFLPAVQPLIPRLQFEAASNKEPPLLECVLALSLSPGLARVLGDMSTVPDETLSLVRPASAGTAITAATRGGGEAAAQADADPMEEDGEKKADPGAGDGSGAETERKDWQVQGMGSALIRGVVAMLSSGRCTEIVRATVLDVLDAVLGCGERLLHRVLLPWLPDVLKALNVAISESWQRDPGGSAGRGKIRRRGPNSTSHRELVILERLGAFVVDSELARSLADTLVALLTQAAARSQRRRSSGKARGRLDEAGIARALAVLAALWTRLKAGDLPAASVERYCEVMSWWAIRLTGREPRAQLAAAYGAVARLLPRMVAPAALLTELTAWSAASLDDIDYDRRLTAYGRLTAVAWGAMDYIQALPLLLTALYDLRNANDLALRQAAAAAVANLVTALSALESAAASSSSVAVDVGGGGGDGDGVAATAFTTLTTDPPESLLRLTGRVLYPQIRSQLCTSSLAVRQEHLSLLRALAVALPRRFADLAHLLSHDDIETDFFNNVAHLQVHRRTRALTKLTKMLRAQSAAAVTAETPAGLPPPAPQPLGRCIIEIVIPLLQQFIEEGADGSGGGKKQSDIDKEANVTDAAVTALGAVAATLPWPQYEQLLNQFMRAMRARPAKPHIRAVCAILDNFHFPLPDAEAAADGQPGGAATAVTAARAQKRKQPTEGENLDESTDDDGGMGKDEAYGAAEAAAAVQRSLLVRVLPALHEQLVERKRGEDEEVASVRAPIALALVKLLKLLPPAAEQAELPRTLQGVTNLLRSRIQRVRDDARAVLVSMMAELGPRYLPYACHVLRASLPDRGFTAHVIGYTLHAVLEAVVKVSRGENAAAAATAAVAEPAGGDNAATAAAATLSGYDIDDDDSEGSAQDGKGEDEGSVGVLDDSLELCLPLLEADLFGEVSEAKEVTTFAVQYKEAKRCRANESYQLLASGITFSTHMKLLMTLVTDRLHLAGQPTVRAKLVQLLQFAARGVRVNPTAGPKQIMTLVVGIMEGCLYREEAARARAKAAVGPAFSAAAGLAPALHETLVLEFCLTLLHSGVKRGALAGRSPELMAHLDPALPLLVRSLRSRQAGCVSLALRTLAHIVPLPLPSLRVAAPAAGTALNALLKKVPNIRHPIAQECFRLLAALLRDCEAYQPTTAQVQYLLRWAFEDLGEAGAQPTAFALLRALLSRRVVVPEVYDVMDRVQQIMVRSQSAPVRNACGVALLQFLLDFPLGPQRLKQHVGFLLANLEYEYESGRLQVLDMLAQVVAKFPVEVLQAHADVLLMPLIVRLVSDTSAKARAATGDLLRALLSRLEASQLGKVVSYCRAWLERGAGVGGAGVGGGGGGGGAQDAALRRAAVQTLGFVAEVEGSKFGRRFSDLVNGVLRILQRQVARGVDGNEDQSASLPDDESADAEAACPGWQEAYYCLLLLEKVAAQASGALAWPIQGAATASSLVPELWESTVRLLLHRHMWVRKAAARLVGYGLATPRVCGGLMASQPGRAAQLAFSFYLQLECEGVDEATCLQAVKCLVNLSVHLHRDDSNEDQNGGHVSHEDQREKHEQQEQRKRAREDRGHGSHAAGSGDGAGKRARGAADAGNGNSNGKDSRRYEEAEEEGEDGTEEQGDGDEDAGKGEQAKGEEAEEEEEADAAVAAATDGDGADGSDEEDGEGPDEQRQTFTLSGLVRRMVRLADDVRAERTCQRMAALRWIAAAATALGAADIATYLPVLLRPLYRISDAAAASAGERHSGITATAAARGGQVPEDVRHLAEEVMAHLRGLVGSEVLLASYNAAREYVRGRRAERKRRTAMRTMIDPAAAAAARRRDNLRQTARRKQKMEVLKRERSAKQLRQTGRRRGGGRGKRVR
ncbi:hypothetical protein Vafri_15933, partial [Volvox africanus]